MALLTTYSGELAALGGALLRAISSVVYAQAGRTMVPLVLNMAKGWIAIAFMVITLSLQSSPIPALNRDQWLLLIGSGIVGIGIGDTAFFAALNALGARRTVLLEALAPPLAALLAIIWLGEVLDWTAYLGIGVTVLGVTWVVMERTAPADATPTQSNQPQLPSPSAPSSRRGLICAILAACCQAIGAVMSRAALDSTSIGPLWSGLIRLTAGTGMVMVLIGVSLASQRLEPRVFHPLRSPSFVSLIATTAFGSTFLAIWLQQAALKYTATGIAQALSATSPLFVIPLALLIGDRVTLRAIVGVLVALGGIWLLFD